MKLSAIGCRLLKCSILLLSFSTYAVPEGNPDRGKLLSGPCTTCHNADGNSSAPIWPNIAGQQESYLVEQLIEFRKMDKGARHNPIMDPFVQSLSDQDIFDLASFFSMQITKLGKTQANLKLLGEKIYRGGNIETGVPSCAGCHSMDGSGNELAKFPKLSGQHADYIAGELKKFQTGERANDPNAIMRDIAKRMSDPEIEAVSSYVAGLHP